MHEMSRPALDWSDLRVFLAIAREGTLGAAARKIGQTQPTMGRRLRALEAALGHVLFQRTADGFVLTDEGGTLLRHAERIEAETLAAQRQLAAGVHDIDGLLRISTLDWFAIYMLAPVLSEFGLQYPKASVELLTDARLYSLPRREADMVIRMRPFDEPEVIGRRLVTVPYALYAPIGSAVPTFGDGAGLRVVTMHEAYAGRPDVLWLQRALPHATAGFSSNNLAVQAQMCAWGAGYTVLPRPVGDATPGIAAIDLDEPLPGRDQYIGYHRDLRRLPRLRALMDMIVARLAD